MKRRLSLRSARTGAGEKKTNPFALSLSKGGKPKLNKPKGLRHSREGSESRYFPLSLGERAGVRVGLLIHGFPPSRE